MKAYSRIVFMLLFGVFILSACAGDDSSGDGGNKDGDGDGDVGTITLYSPETPDLSKELAQKFEEVHGGTVNVDYAGTNVLVNKMMAEKGNPQADVWYGGGGLLPFESAVDKDIIDRKSTRLNSSHVAISYAVFCLK